MLLLHKGVTNPSHTQKSQGTVSKEARQEGGAAGGGDGECRRDKVPEGPMLLKDRIRTEPHGVANMHCHDCPNQGRPTPNNKRDKVSMHTSLTDISDKARFQRKTPARRNIVKMGYTWATPALNKACDMHTWTDSWRLS